MENRRAACTSMARRAPGCRSAPTARFEADVAAERLVRRQTTADLSYSISLLCSPRAYRRARRVWSLAAEGRDPEENILSIVQPARI